MLIKKKITNRLIEEYENFLMKMIFNQLIIKILIKLIVIHKKLS